MVYNGLYNNEHIKIKKVASGLSDATMFGAFEQGTLLTLKLYISRKVAAYNIKLLLYNDDYKINITQNFKFYDIYDGYDIYTTDIKMETCALIFYKIEYDSPYGVKYITNPLTNDNSFQLSVYDKNFTTPDWIKGGVIYQIFVDRFNKSDKQIKPKKDTFINEDWYNGIPIHADKPGDPVDNNDFFGGNLYGVADKLGYIKSLGCNCIYLNPIFEAHTNHKYDIGDFNKIDSMFGGEAAFDYLIQEADKHGIRIILDGVFNHTGADSRYFNKFGTYPTKGAYQSKRSQYYCWYKFIDYPDKYECWWNVDILPAVDDSCKSYREFINGKDGIIRKYLRKGIAGWRLDVVDELSQSFVEEIREAAKSENEQSLIIGEVWEDASNKIAYDKRRHYFRGYELDSVMNYPLRDAIIDFVNNGNADKLYKTSTLIYENYPKHVSDSLMNILGTHDTERILTVLGDLKQRSNKNKELAKLKLTNDEYDSAMVKLKLASLICYTMYGVPSIYYGDEAGMQGYRDPFNRRCYPWGKEKTALIDWYRKLGQLRKENADFTDGIFKVLHHADGIIVYVRNRTIIAVNVSNDEFVFNNFKIQPMSGLIIKDNEIILNSIYS